MTGVAQGRLEQLERWLTLAENTLAATALLGILFVSLAEITARNLLHSGVPGADVAMRHLVLWVAFLGAVLAVREQRHIKIDVLTAWLPDAWLAKLARPFNFFSAAVCGLLGWASVTFWQSEWQTVPPDEKWATALALILPISFCLLVVHFILLGLLGRRPPRHNAP